MGGEDNDENRVNTTQLPDNSFLYDTSLADLAEATSYYDGQTVQIIGEAIGDILNDGTNGTYVWVTLTSTDEDSDATVSVYMTASSAELIDTLGAYGKTGTTLQVRGTFHLACSEHDGESDIHAESVTVVSQGSTTTEEFVREDFMVGIISLVVAGVLIFVFYLLRQRLR